MKRVIRLYYFFQFFFALLLWLPIFYEYQKRIGLTDAEIFSIQSIYYIAFCLLEIPTGFLADRWGRLRCLRLGAGMLFISNLLPIFSANYAGFLAHFLLIALSRSLISGAASAYLYDSLAQAGMAAQYKQVEGNARAYGLVGKIGGWTVIGALMQWHLTLPYWLTAINALIAMSVAFFLPPLVTGAAETREARAPRAPGAQRGPGLKAVFRVLIASPALLLIMVQGIAIFVMDRITQVNLFQPILQDKAFGLSSYGVVLAVATVFEALGSFRPGILRRFTSDWNAVFGLTVMMAGLLIAIPLLGQVGTIVCLSAYSLATGFAFPIQRQLMNDAIPDSRYRATLLSCESIVDRAVSAWVASVLGSFLTAGQLSRFLFLAGASTAIFAVAVFVLSRMLRLGALRNGFDQEPSKTLTSSLQ